MFIRKKRGLMLFMLLLMVVILLGACRGDGEESEANSSEQEDTANIVVKGDTINSHNVEDAVCIVNSRFEQGWRMLFRASVIDENTGELIEDADVKAVLETGEEFEMELGPHGPEETLLYTVPWEIPEDFNTGTLNYEIIATVNGEEYTYEPFDVEPSKMTIIESGEGQDSDE
ncbi:hypothetical protein [Oceanobacillus neutriphilus]|uniref:DUF4352 domain-containing protein n=1 Tax=Oceanobacillus neutriphilus TaxID=531815 RepID=A0ABQ2P3A8_9BACI|nr:hypothetical protein [Oceanobacillus neutriphilus]GGP17095.1 hypothetical protein GCM10011346_51700 [Oceanobacillus neutriphilus]